jgi:glycerophosphoryl diester phosphodiesterase
MILGLMLAMKIIAHMGASQEAPENTLPAFEKAIEMHADIIEFDVRITQDSIPVVIHDASVGWDCEIPENHPIKNLTLQKLQQFDLGQWYLPKFKGERVPTLESVLKLNASFMVEIKWMGEPFKPDIDLILPYLEGKNCVVGCMIPEVVNYVKQQGWHTVGIVQSAPLLEKFIAIHPDILALRFQLIKPGIIERLHDLGIEVWGWTIDDIHQAKVFEEMGLDGIITNNVRGLRNAF